MFERIFFNSTDLPQIFPIVCGRRACPPDWHIDRLNVENPLLHYVVKGSGTFQKNGVVHSIQAGEMFILRPGESGSYTASHDDPWDYIWCRFSCSARLEAMLAEDVISIPSAAPLFTQISACRNEPAKEWVVTGLLYQLFAKLANSDNLPMSSKSYVAQAVSYIEANYFNNVQISDLAEKLGLSRSYLCRVFKKQTGVSPQEYLVSYRLEKAADYLTTYKMTQKEVALQVGYPDVYAFSRMFKRKFGISPGQYKRAHSSSPLDISE